MIWIDNLVIAFGGFIELFLIYDYFKNFFEIKVINKYVKYIFIVTWIMFFCINKVGNSWLNLFSIPVILFLFVSILFESKINTRVAYFVLAYVVMVAVEFLYFILTETTMKMITATGVVPIADLGWQTVFIKFLNYIIFLILKQTSKKSHSKMNNKVFMVYLIVPISTLGIMLTVFYSGFDISANIVLRAIMTMFLIFVLLGNVIMFYTFQKHTEEINEAARQEIELNYKNSEIKRLNKIVEIDDEYNETIHNMTHSLRLIEQLAEENNADNIREVVETLMGRITKRDTCEFCNCKVLNAILSEYVENAKSQNIVFDIDVEPGCDISVMKDIDIASVVGNLLDNAFEAVGQVENGKVKFQMYTHDMGDMSIVRIVNDFNHELSIQNGKILTTKKQKGVHGIGLMSISKTTEKYDGSFIYYTENNKFIALIILPKIS